jgi:hypothetical protein
VQLVEQCCQAGALTFKNKIGASYGVGWALHVLPLNRHMRLWLPDLGWAASGSFFHLIDVRRRLEFFLDVYVDENCLLDVFCQPNRMMIDI